MTVETKLDAKLDQLKVEMTQHIDLSIERFRSSMFRWMLAFFAPLWLGVYLTLAAIVLRS